MRQPAAREHETDTRRASVDVVLVSMPWQAVEIPSIQLGILQPLLQQHGFETQTRSLSLAFLDHCQRTLGFTVEDYRAISEEWGFLGLGDWIFAGPPFPSARCSEVEYPRYLRRAGVRPADIEKAVAVRAIVPDFLDRWTDEILDTSPTVVGFTTTFSQNVPSLALAARLKQRHPAVRIVFGGSNCDGPMGEALLRGFDCIDVVVRGEGEPVVPDLVGDLVAGRPVRAQAGLCVRDGERIVAIPQSFSRSFEMDAVPTPQFDEYFAQLSACSCGASLEPEIRLSYESARGCWWGMRAHCTFCGLNGTSMTFRSKSPARVLDELRTLADRYGRREFQVVDNILDLRYLREVLPALRDAGRPFGLFYETKANLSRRQVRLLAESGVDRIQPGIESLSTPILRLMRKGVSAFQNIRLLKWCAHYRIRVVWNIIYGFPGEPEPEYARMTELVESLRHLQSPMMSPLVLERFSPYHERPASYGLEMLGPLPWYRMVYGLDEAALGSLAYAFEHRHADRRDPERYAAPLRAAVDRWRTELSWSYRALRYRRTPRGLVIDDRRTAAQRYTLGDIEGRLYLACEDGATAGEALDRLPRDRRARIDVDEVTAFLDESVALRLAYEERGRYLALALPDTDARDEHEHDPVNASLHGDHAWPKPRRRRARNAS